MSENQGSPFDPTNPYANLESEEIFLQPEHTGTWAKADLVGGMRYQSKTRSQSSFWVEMKYNVSGSRYLSPMEQQVLKDILAEAAGNIRFEASFDGEVGNSIQIVCPFISGETDRFMLFGWSKSVEGSLLDMLTKIKGVCFKVSQTFKSHAMREQEVKRLGDRFEGPRWKVLNPKQDGDDGNEGLIPLQINEN